MVECLEFFENQESGEDETRGYARSPTELENGG